MTTDMVMFFIVSFPYAFSLIGPVYHFNQSN